MRNEYLNEYLRAVLVNGKFGEYILKSLQKIRIINNLLINGGITENQVEKLQPSLDIKTSLKNCPEHKCPKVLWIEIDRVLVCPEGHENEGPQDDTRLPSAGINRTD